MHVLSSFHSALASLGHSAPASAETPQPAAVPTPSTIPPQETDSAGPNRQASSLTYRRSERTTLYIQTQEGDVVRLKFSSREATSLETAYERGGGIETTELSLQTRTASKLSVRVRGDLNAEELAAIVDTINQAVELADDFFGGDVQAAFQSAAAFDIDGEQLAMVTLKMRMKERLTYTAVGFVGPSVAAASGTGPTALPSVPDTSVEAENPAPQSTEPSAEPGAEPATEEPTGGAEAGAAVARHHALNAVGDFLGRILAALSADEAESPAHSLHTSLKIRIVQSTFLTLALTRTEEPLQELAIETLDALAEQEQEPVSHVA